MASRERRTDAGRRRARELTTAICTEFRSVRIAAGLTQRDVAKAAGLTRSRYGRIERLERDSVSVDELARVGAALGLGFSMRVYPDGPPIRDAGHVRVTTRFIALLPPTLRWRPEVPLPRVGDRRAWDGAIDGRGDWIPVEVETRLRDVQAFARSVTTKARDGEVGRVLLVLADTPANRQAAQAGDAILRSLFPMPGREVLRAIRAGRVPERGGIVFV